MRNTLLQLPPLDAIRGFVAVVRRMSITLAAQDLCLTQSAVSRQIKLLETHLGTPLLVRKHRAIALTEAGTELFQLAGPWLDQLFEFSQALSAREHALPVTITASIGVTSLWLLPRFGSFQALHPTIDVRIATSNRLLDIAQENIDLAIRYCTEANAPPDAIRLFDEEVAPVARPDIAARAFTSSATLLDQVFLELDDRARPWLRWSEWLGARGMADARPRATLYFNQYDQLIQAALEGHGVALGRLGLIFPLVDTGQLVAQHDGQLGSSDFAYWLAQSEAKPRRDVQVLADWIALQARATAASLSTRRH
ncbi:LysR family transcriptional regulator [Oxalobacteraceae bacterium]|nr:LysR family transcriptional regulator [Oxalobacteraceae bacterium]